MGVTEHLLTTQHAFVTEHNMLAVCKFRQFNLAIFEPLRIRFLCSERFFDLSVINNASLRRVNQQHSPWLQATLHHDLARVNVYDADFASHDYAIIICHPISTRTQTVSIQNCTNDCAVGKRDAGWSVPRLNQRAVILIKRTLGC